ncbi:4834_t:CDS:2 [Rhizophagus irregularis]|uniref:Uncharacterized protein n=1 Tax=Rhizophagus irregularis (strain DAOM 181602 / DAOM 197198 / MUCL 43194) TaxID=747089 RepID=U9UAF8_RHIID|nr:4834_t:CDS:2 [Rhizophagus irregularis]
MTSSISVNYHLLYLITWVSYESSFLLCRNQYLSDRTRDEIDSLSARDAANDKYINYN